LTVGIIGIIIGAIALAMRRMVKWEG
jgi:hypothetical protein